MHGFENAVKATAESLGIRAEVIMVDLLNGEEYDVANENIAKKWEHMLDKGQVDAVLAPPPCSTFSRARTGPGGPRPLRGAAGRDRYGLPHLRPEEKEATRLGTLLAIRAQRLCALAHAMGVPWIVENPEEKPGWPSLFGLDEWLELIGREGVVCKVVD